MSSVQPIQQSSPKAKWADAFPLRVLAVDDNPINISVIEALMKRMGYRIDIARNGVEAINAVQKRDYDLIFMDLQMPLKNGIDATREIKLLKGNECPYISAFTANTDETYRVACAEIGMDDFICKPANIRDLTKVVNKAYQKQFGEKE